jgi:hypothetical protein
MSTPNAELPAPKADGSGDLLGVMVKIILNSANEEVSYLLALIGVGCNLDWEQSAYYLLGNSIHAPSFPLGSLNSRQRRMARKRNRA